MCRDSRKCKKASKKIVLYPVLFGENLKQVITDIADKRFVDWWRGIFIRTDFSEDDKEKGLDQLRKLVQ